MSNSKVRIYRLDGDCLESVSTYDEPSGIWIEEYIDFESAPRYTPSGHPWKSVTHIGCPYADPLYRDCGTCPHLMKEQSSDLIGICLNEKMKMKL